MHRKGSGIVSSFSMCVQIHEPDWSSLSPPNPKQIGRGQKPAPVFASVWKQRESNLREPVIENPIASVTIEREKDPTIFTLPLRDCRGVATSWTLDKQSSVQLCDFNTKATEVAKDFACCDNATLDRDSDRVFRGKASNEGLCRFGQ